MKEKIIKYLPLIANLISLTVLTTVIIYAQLGGYTGSWKAPTGQASTNNVPAPINTLEPGQSKIGGLLLNTGGAATGLTVASGKVEILGGGLSVFGNITSGGTIKASTFCLGASCINAWPTGTTIVSEPPSPTLKNCTWGSKTYTSGATCISASSWSCNIYCTCHIGDPNPAGCYNTVKQCYNGEWYELPYSSYCSTSPCTTTCGK